MVLMAFIVFSGNLLAKEEIKRIKLLEVISEPEEGLKRVIYLHIDQKSEIKRLDVDIEGKTSVSANVLEMKNNEILMANVLGFDSVFLSCDPCTKTQKEINLKYLLNGATGKFRTKKLRLVKHKGSWIAKELRTDVAVSTLKFTSNKVLGILVGVEEVIVNPN